jgi:hypothetical protein
MQYIQGTHRHQSYFSTLEEQVSSHNPVRLMDAFTSLLGFSSNKLKTSQPGFCRGNVCRLAEPGAIQKSFSLQLL